MEGELMKYQDQVIQKEINFRFAPLHSRNLNLHPAVALPDLYFGKSAILLLFLIFVPKHVCNKPLISGHTFTPHITHSFYNV